MRLRRLRAQGNRGFTLIEVILAVVIMVGMLGIVLYFHQRIVETRRNALTEAEAISTVRLLLDRMATELRLARASENPVLVFEGSSNAVRFITVTLSPPGRWLGSNALSGDLRRIYYGLARGTNETEVLGIERREELPFLLIRPEPDLSVASESEDGEASGAVEEGTGVVSDGTNTGESLATTEETDLALSGEGVLITDTIRFLQFRYFDGLEWVLTWSSTRLPRGVEIRLGRDALLEEDVMETEELETFRRVVFIAGSEHPAIGLPTGVEQGVAP